jgi:hypothetical protein
MEPRNRRKKRKTIPKSEKEPTKMKRKRKPKFDLFYRKIPNAH